jgi:translation initiation factor 1 (eIF-1/SUI1)
MAAALVGSNIVAVTGIAEDTEGAAVLKRYLADTLATLGSVNK